MNDVEFLTAVSALEFPGIVAVAIDPDGLVLGVNAHGLGLAGGSADGLAGRPWADCFVAPDERAAAQATLRQALSGQGLPIEATMITHTGQRRVLSWHVVVRAGAALCIGVDATARARAQADLLASESKMQAVIENAVEGIVTINQRGVIQTANRAACRIFGYEQAELIGRNVNVLMPSPDRENHDGYLRRYLETGIAGIIGRGREVIAQRKNGERFPIYLSVSDVMHEAGIFTGLVRDLTEEKRLQKQLVEQEALATLGRMATVVAHEVKNPLAGIAGVIQILRSRVGEGSEEHQVMGDVLGRIDALVETIQDMLFYARPRELRRASVCVAALLAESARLMRHDGKFKDVEVKIADSALELPLDAEYFKEALLNLFLNAAQAVGGKGVIRAEIEAAGGAVLIRIADSGPGIPPAIRDKVFEPFFTTKGRGTGLGLALVKSVVERHGGHVSIECPAQGGTVVTLQLPAPAAN